jgi:hypothetical protein
MDLWPGKYFGLWPEIACCWSRFKACSRHHLSSFSFFIIVIECAHSSQTFCRICSNTRHIEAYPAIETSVVFLMFDNLESAYAHDATIDANYNHSFNITLGD